MDKRKVNTYLPKALEACRMFLAETERSAEGETVASNRIKKGFRSQISAFGASVVMGSFKAAVAFFGKQGNADVDRSKLIIACYYIIRNETKRADEIVTSVLEMNEAAANGLKDDFINASLAIKLAMNSFHLV